MLQRSVLLFCLLISCSMFKITAGSDSIDFLRDLQHWEGAKDLAFAINKQTTALRAMQDEKTLAAFSEKFIGSKHIKKINFYYSENIEKDHEKNKKFLRYLWVLFNFFSRKIEGLERNQLVFAKKFYNGIIDAIAENNKKTRDIVLCLKYMYFTFNFPNITFEMREACILSALKKLVTDQQMSPENIDQLINNLKKCWRYFKDFELGVEKGARVLVLDLNSPQGKGERDALEDVELCYKSVLSILKKLENEFCGKPADSKEDVRHSLGSSIQMLDPEDGILKKVVILTEKEFEAMVKEKQKSEEKVEKNVSPFPQTSDQQSESEPAKQIVNVEPALLEKIIDDEEAHEDLPKASLVSSTKNKSPLFAVGTIFVAVGGTYYVVEKTKYGKQLKQFAKEHPKTAITLSGLATIIVGGGAAMIYKSVNN